MALPNVAIPTESVLRRPNYGLDAAIFFPLSGLLSSGKSLGTAATILQFQIFLDQLIEMPGGRRNLNQDYPPEDFFKEGDLEEDWDWQQSWLLEWMEDSLNEYGLDGRACGLRFICELEHHPIDRFAILGELLAIAFDVQNSTSSDVISQYASARNFGKGLPDGENCGNMFDCPVSIFKLFGGSLNRNF